MNRLMSKQQSQAPARDERTGATYDETPYSSYTYPNTHPERQALVAKLLGFSPAKLEKARVLELGCAGGGNILPLAIDFPDAEFYGIDLSPVQIEEANRHKAALTLANIKFEALDIMDVGPQHGKFDYIICHGVFSWVPDFVREKILNICRENLTPNGLACLSFNVMPGWAAQRAMREMMILHTRKTQDVAQKVQQAKTLVDFLARFMPKGTPMQQAVLAVHEKFQGTDKDSYVLHEYLEPNNNQFYFLDFAEMLEKNNLQYVGDSDLGSMHTGNMGAETDQALKSIHDPLMREQYIDFISGRQFRHAIVTAKSNKAGSASLDVVDDLYFTCEMQAQSAQPDGQGFIKFQKGNTGMFVNIGDSLSQVLFRRMQENAHKAYSYKEMVDMVTGELGEENREQVSRALKGNAILYSLKAFLQPQLRPSRHTNTVSHKPRAFALSRYHAGFPNAPYVITANYSFSKLNPLELALLRHLDGENNHTRLVEKMFEDLKDSTDIFKDSNNMPVTDPARQKDALKTSLPRLLENMVAHGILVA